MGRVHQVRERFAEAVGLALDADLPGMDVTGLNGYSGRLRRPAELQRFLTFYDDLLHLAGVDVTGMRVVDAGCGFGLPVLLMACLGAERVTGIVIEERMARTAQAYLTRMPPDLAGRVEYVLGDVAAMPLEDGKADLVLSVEAISHYRDHLRFLEEARRVLRPGGRLVISDGNNGLNPLTRHANAELWEAYEVGPPGRLAHGRRVGNPYGPHRDRRRAIVAEAHPGLGDDELDRIARGTTGMSRPETLEAARRYVDDGVAPTRFFRRGMLTGDPDWGVSERLFNPYSLGREIARRGFRVKVHGYWGGADGRTAVRAANRVLSALGPVTMPAARAFRVVAIRS